MSGVLYVMKRKGMVLNLIILITASMCLAFRLLSTECFNSIASTNMLCTSLELARKLKECGYPQNYDDDSQTLPDSGNGTYFCWENTERFCSAAACNCGKTHGGWIVRRRDDNNYNPFLASPTAEELLKEIPKDINVDGAGYNLEIYFCGKDGNCVTYNPDYENKRGGSLADFSGDTLVDALAQMYCYLHTQKYL